MSSYIRQLNESHFLSVNNSIITVSCHFKTNIINDCSYCLVQVPCGCSISTKEFYFPKRHTKCNHQNDTKNMSVVHPVNLIVLHKFFGLNAISNISSDTVFPTPLNISIKPIRYFDHEFSNLIANDQRAHLNLDRVIQRAKENKVIYQNLVEPFLNSEINDSYISAFDIVSFVSIGLSIFAIISVFFMYRKYRKFLAVVTMLKRAGHTTAYPTLPSFIYTEAPTTTAPTHIQNIHVHIHNFTSYIILAFGLFLVIYIIYKRIRSPRPNLMIDITNGRECMTSFIMHLPLCIQSCHFHSSLSMQIFSIQGMLKPTLSIDWGDLIIFSETNETLSLTLPSTIPVSMYTAYKIRKTFKRGLPLITQLWACHQSFGMPIKYCDSSCPLQNINTSNSPDQS